MTIEQVEADPYCSFAYSYSVTQEFAQAIKEVVVEYYGYQDNLLSQLETSTLSTTSSYELQYSTVVGEWDEDYTEYNCYAYALNRTDYFYKPGEIYGYEFSMSLDLATMAEYIKADLNKMGKQCVRVSTICPNLGTLNDNQSAICYRIGNYDFHFMRMGDDAWYHKPAGTNPLRYNSLPTVYENWTNERVIDGVAYSATTVYYSTIYYFVYATMHDWDYSSNGNKTHTLSCTSCSETETDNCDLTYTYIGSACHRTECAECDYTVYYSACSGTFRYNGYYTHRRTCDYCGNSVVYSCNNVCEYAGSGSHYLRCSTCENVSFASCTQAYTYCGSETSGDVHQSVCTGCGHAYSGVNSCTFAYVPYGTGQHIRQCTVCAYQSGSPEDCIYVDDGVCLCCG